MSGHRSKLFDRIGATAGELMVCAQTGMRFDGPALLEKVDAVVGWLRDNGVGVGDRVLAQLPNGMPFAVLYLACLRARAVVVPLSPRSTQSDLDYAVGLARPRLHVTLDAAAAGLPALHLDQAELERLPARRNLPECYEDDDLFSINFTSGTTSRPKAVVHRAEGIVGNAAAFNSIVGYGPDNRMLHVMPMYYMAGLLNTLLCPLAAGAAVVLAPQFSPRSALSLFRQAIEHDVTATWLSPSMLEMAMRLDRGVDTRERLRRTLRFAFIGTAALGASLARQFFERYGVEALQSYGLSELLLLTVDRPHSTKFGSVGHLLPDVGARLSGEGELLVSTPHAFFGYLDPMDGATPAPATSEAVRRDFPTGDLASIDEDGRITIDGRIKDILVVGGFNVSPLAVEEALGEHAMVQQAAVVGAAHPLLGEAPVAFIVPFPGAEPDELERALRLLAATRLTAAARPVRYVMQRTVPVGPTGKVQKHQLPKVDLMADDVP